MYLKGIEYFYILVNTYLRRYTCFFSYFVLVKSIWCIIGVGRWANVDIYIILGIFVQYITQQYHCFPLSNTGSVLPDSCSQVLL